MPGANRDAGPSRYIYPPTLRTKLSELWNIPELHYWWLPDDQGYPPIIRSIRSFIEDRTMTPKDQPGEDLRDIKNILQKVNLDDSPIHSPASVASVETAYSRRSISSVGVGARGRAPSYSSDQNFGGRTMSDPTSLQQHSPAYWEEYGMGGGTEFFAPPGRR